MFAQNITVTQGQAVNNRIPLSINIAANTNFNSNDRVEIPITVTCAKGSRTVTYTLLALKKGEDGSVYKLLAETNEVIGRYSGTELVLDHSTVSCTRNVVKGGSVIASNEGELRYSIDGGEHENIYAGPVSVQSALTAGKIIFYWYIGDVMVDRESVPILKDGMPGTSSNGKDAIPIRIRNWSDVYGANLSGNQKLFSGFEANAPFKDLVVVSAADYVGAGISYPFTGQNGDIPTVMGINYSSNRESGWNGTELVLPAGGTDINYSTVYPATKAESAAQRAETKPKFWYVFQSLGALYTQILVAMQAYIGELTVDDILANHANIAGFVFDEGVLKSLSETLEGDPNLILDGTNGRLVANNAIINGGQVGPLTADRFGLRGTFEETDDSVQIPIHNESEIEITPQELRLEASRSRSSHTTSGVFTVGMDNQGFVDIQGEKSTAGGFGTLLNVGGDANFDGVIRFKQKVVVTSEESWPVTAPSSSLIIVDSNNGGTAGTIHLPSNPTRGTWLEIATNYACVLSCSSPAEIRKIGIVPDHDTTLNMTADNKLHKVVYVGGSTYPYWLVM